MNRIATTPPICQWCNNLDTIISGHSPLCIETEYKCQQCGETTFRDDTTEQAPT